MGKDPWSYDNFVLKIIYNENKNKSDIKAGEVLSVFFYLLHVKLFVPPPFKFVLEIQSIQLSMNIEIQKNFYSVRALEQYLASDQ